MQLLPETAEGIALRTGGTAFVVADLRDPEINVRYGSWYLDHLLERYGDARLALAAYHAGQGNVDEWRRAGAGIAFPETRDYVEQVLETRDVYERVYRDELR
jgi:soluble lytic murein transglycosylase